MLPELPQVLVEVMFRVTWKHWEVDSAPFTAVPWMRMMLSLRCH